MWNDATRNENVDPAGIRAINPCVELQATLLFNGPSEHGVNARGVKPKGNETKDVRVQKMVRVWGRKLRAEVVRVGGGGGGDGSGGGGGGGGGGGKRDRPRINIRTAI
ncbi:hypothetical protein ALC53_01566 [Atta colombica]|uniref:Uncharacterized protein n=1 Tax=Atta colombica TaxID=520822 RepID=A0A195BU59_9HYME|nr:hypothetical protein ALC53_01566 [Atta colombica]